MTTFGLLQLNDLFAIARDRKASDVHVHPDSQPSLRIDGQLIRITHVPPVEIGNDVLDGLLTPRQRRALTDSGDLTIAYEDGSGPVRVHFFRTANGWSLAARILSRDIPALETLGLPSAVATFAKRASGLVIFAGPTGSGKTTALAALIDRINTESARHIVTIEDPIEYLHSTRKSLLSCRQIDRESESFVSAVQAALRIDPDVLLVGEMRDRETMRATLQAAETGHLVFTTLHTGDASQTVDRIVDSFDGADQRQIRIQLAQTLAAVVCLRLVPRRSNGGRRCAAEVLVSSDAIRNLIREGKTHHIRNAIATSRHLGMQTLEAHLRELVAEGTISCSDARAVCDRPEEIDAIGPAA